MVTKIGTIKISDLEFIVREARKIGGTASTELVVELDSETFVKKAIRIDSYPVAYLPQ